MDKDSGENAQDAQDARIRNLWQSLGASGTNDCLDYNGLRAGLHKIDHPLKEADGLLSETLKRADRDGDGKIQYGDFAVFVRHADKALRSLFTSIDHDKDGKLTKGELGAAFTSAGIPLTPQKLDHFFNSLDTNHDGVISFEEWRHFFLFIPAETPGLKAVMSYYANSVQVNPEGDVHVSDETRQGLGTAPSRSPFSLLRIFAPPPKPRPRQQQQEPEPPPPPLPPVLLQQPSTLEAEADPIPVAVARQKEDEIKATEQALGAAEIVSGNTDEAWRLRTWLMALMPVSLGYFVAGAVAGMVSRTTTAPLDRLKVYLIAQTNPTSKALEAARGGKMMQASKHVMQPLADAIRALWAAGGIRSLFAGNGLNVVKVMPESAIKFGGYEAAKRLFSKLEGHGEPSQINPWSRFLAGGMGGIVSQLFAYPLDTLKFRMQCETVPGGLYGNKLIAATAQKMWAAAGPRSFYTGLTWGLVGQFPYSAIDLSTFEGLKRWLIKRNMKLRKCSEEDASPGAVTTAVIGGFSGALGASLVYPLNLLRTRLQTQGTVEHPRTYTGIADVTRQTIKGEGFRGLFKGITPNLVKVVPAVSITYVVYEGSKKALKLP